VSFSVIAAVDVITQYKHCLVLFQADYKAM
jgi:hypothetical protein